jgi:Domain of unknown function (DUF5127)/Domain of unknown function (DUF4965)/Domain of unknown function (DUF1793)/Domain of unknown function (DUF4964)
MGSVTVMDRRMFLRLGGAAAAAVPLWWMGDEGWAAAASVPEATVAPIRPPAVPLAVRGPYTSTWLQGTDSAGLWPRFWTSTVTGLCGLVQVDGYTYAWTGAPTDSIRPKNMTQTGLEITPTRSIFTFTAGGVEVTVEWLSPVEPGNTQLQSIPLTLLTVSVVATDGKSHKVLLYADVTGEWASGTATDKIRWSTSTSGPVRTWTCELAEPEVFTEHDAVAAWGSVVWSTTPRGSGLTYQSGRDATVRNRFIQTGKLGDSDDTDYRAIDDDWPVFAFVHDLGTVAKTAQSVSYSIGHARTPSINYQGSQLAAWWSRYWSSAEDMAAWFLGQAGAARSRAISLDSRITTAATSAGGADYAALCVLGLRQAYGACELVVGTDGEPWGFLKEVSSGSFVNTVDVICPAMPVWLYLDPGFLSMLLQPVLSYAASKVWTNDWAPHDLGSYPNATSTTGGFEQMPIEETAGMLIMAAAYAAKLTASGAKAWLAPYTALWTTWAGYLADPANLPDPPSQLSTDDFAGPIAGSVNLAIKGIIGLGAAAQIATLLGNDNDATQWKATAAQYATTWQQQSTDNAAPHLDFTEGGTGIWGDLYNAYCDTLLGTGLVPTSVAALQAAWYEDNLDTYGLLLQSNQPTWAKVDWNAWTAAWLRAYPVADRLYAAVAAYADTTPDRTAFGDFYNPTTGAVDNFKARPVVGAMYALLALPNQA